MGWISKRKMETGGSIGSGGLGEKKKGAPLRKITGVIHGQDNIFSTARVVFECGHEGESWGGVRGRCVKCKEEGRR